MTQEDRSFIVICTASVITVIIFTDEWFRVTMAVIWAVAAVLATVGNVAHEIAAYHRKAKSRGSASRRLHDACAAQMREDGKENLP